MVRAIAAIAAVVVACVTLPGATLAAGSETPKSDRGAPPAAPKPVAPIGPKSTTAAFGDWMVACVATDAVGKSGSNCSMTQRLRKNGDGSDLALYSLNLGKTEAEVRFLVVVPANVTLIAPPRLEHLGVKEEARALVWKSCAVGGCVADADLSIEEWRALTRRTSQGLHFTYKDVRGQAVDLPVSLEGVDDAFRALMSAGSRR
ncbi:MAG: invasion associated locus B family protein [Hyphomicrobiales bacterium]|nr:invasion associated locus B family protein [Hyphomicrobiales bacterium]